METTPTQLEPIRFTDRPSFLLAGLTERYNHGHIEAIPAQWQRFCSYIGKVPGEVGGATYGVCFNFDAAGNMDYMCGVEVAEGSAIPDSLSELRIAEQRYAVFLHRGHISKIGKTWNAIFNEWRETSGHALVIAPQFETYGADFDPETGNVEIWIPIARLSEPRLKEAAAPNPDSSRT